MYQIPDQTGLFHVVKKIALLDEEKPIKWKIFFYRSSDKYEHTYLILRCNIFFYISLLLASIWKLNIKKPHSYHIKNE